MSHPLHQKIEDLQRAARRLRRLQGAARLAASVLAAFLLAGLLDYSLRIEDAGFRVFLAAIVVGASAFGWLRFLVPAWSGRPSDVAAAQRIEGQHPQLQDRLSSAIAFLQQPQRSPAAGSEELRRAVISAAAADAAGLDFRGCLDPRPARKSIAWAGGLAVLTIGLIVLDARAAALAARRLTLPWLHQPWPRRHHLEFVDPPRRLARGADFEAIVVDRNGRLPQAVEIHYEYAGSDPGATQVEIKPMRYFGQRMAHRVDNVQRSFRYRAVGGDDDTMQWISLEVCDPPRVASLRVTLYPPAYTGWPPIASGENIHALQGTRIEARGTLDRAAGSVRLLGEPFDLTGVLVRLSADGLRFRIAEEGDAAWTVAESGTYRFETTDRQGLRGSDERRWSIRAVEDRPPLVSVEAPTANTFVTPAAVVRLDGYAEDDLALRALTVHQRRGDREESPPPLGIYRGPDSLPRAERWLDFTADRSERISLGCDWDLSQMPGLGPGTWIDYEVVAEDYKSQETKSPTRRLTIISIPELEERIAARQTFILGQLAEVLRLQSEVRELVRELEIAVAETAALREADRDRLQGCELRQRDVQHLLADPQDGTEMQIAQLLQELRSNRVENPEVRERMRELAAAVAEVRGSHLPEIQRQLLDAMKLARDPAAGGDSSGVEAALAATIRAAGSSQDAVIEILERLLGELSRWDSYRRFHRELHRVRQDQLAIGQDVESLRLDRLGRDVGDQAAEERLRRMLLAERQKRTADELDKLLDRMESMQRELAGSNPAVAETLDDALTAARRSAVAGRMRESSRFVESARLGEAGELREPILAGLDEILDVLAHRREGELQRRLERLGSAAEALESLRVRQREAATGIEAAAASNAALGELRRAGAAQRELAEPTQSLARQLERLGAAAAAASAGEAAETMQSAAAEAEAGQAASSQQAARRAAQQLEQAGRQLEGETRRVQEQLTEERTAKLEQELAGLIALQEALGASTRQLQQSRGVAGDWTRGQQAELRDAARQQRALAAETSRIGDAAIQAIVFRAACEGSVAEMARAARGLDALDAGESTQQAQRSAQQRLEQVRQSLRRDPRPGDPDTQVTTESPPEDGDPADVAPLLAELKLLKSMQEEVHLRTVDLVQRRDAAIDEAYLEETLAALAAEQGRLAELALELVDPAGEAGELPE